MKDFWIFNGDVEWVVLGDEESSEDGGEGGFIKHETSDPPLLRVCHFLDSSSELDECTHRG